jgi:hypothetical protein
MIINFPTANDNKRMLNESKHLKTESGFGVSVPLHR